MISIGRAGDGHDGRFGNPFVVGKDGEVGECVEKFREWFYSDDMDAEVMREQVDFEIKPGMRLGCFCKPNPCHGDVIAEYVNSKE